MALTLFWNIQSRVAKRAPCLDRTKTCKLKIHYRIIIQFKFCCLLPGNVYDEPQMLQATAVSDIFLKTIVSATWPVSLTNEWARLPVVQSEFVIAGLFVQSEPSLFALPALCYSPIRSSLFNWVAISEMFAFSCQNNIFVIAIWVIVRIVEFLKLIIDWAISPKKLLTKYNSNCILND